MSPFSSRVPERLDLSSDRRGYSLHPLSPPLPLGRRHNTDALLTTLVLLVNLITAASLSARREKSGAAEFIKARPPLHPSRHYHSPEIIINTAPPSLIIRTLSRLKRGWGGGGATNSVSQILGLLSSGNFAFIKNTFNMCCIYD